MSDTVGRERRQGRSVPRRIMRKRFVADFIGDSNIVDGVSQGLSGVLLRRGFLRTAALPGSRVQVVVRPEDIEGIPWMASFVAW